MDYKDLRSIQESYNSMYTEGFPNVKPSNRAGDAGSAGLKLIDTGSGTGYVNKHSGGNVIPPASVDKIMSGRLMVKGGKPKNKTQLAHYEPEGEMVEGMADMVDKATKAGQSGLEKMGVKINRTPRPTARPSVRTQDTMRKNQSSMEEVEVFDIVKGHLIDEHNLSEDVALQLMTILDEEIKADILEYTAAIRADAAPKGTTMRMTAGGKEPPGDKMLRGLKSAVGGFLDKINPKAMKSTPVKQRTPLVATPKNEAYTVAY